MNKFLIILILLTSWVQADVFKSDIQPFLKEYCYECHNHEKQKGKLNLEKVTSIGSDLESVELWQEILDLVSYEEMPPEDEKQPSSELRHSFNSTIEKVLYENRALAKAEATTHLRRLNKTEYTKTVADLLKVDVWLQNPSKNFPVDELEDNFKNNGEVLSFSEYHLNEVILAAEELVDRAIFLEKPERMNLVMQAPFIGNRNVLKAAKQLGGKSHMDLLEKDSYVVHENMSNGVPATGRYKVSFRVKAFNREHKLPASIFKTPQSEPLRASLTLTHSGAENPSYYAARDRVVGEYDLNDDKETAITVDTYIEKGYLPKIGFPNSVQRFKPVKRKLGKHQPFAEFSEVNLKNKKSAYEKFVVGHKFMLDHGPYVRVYEVKVEGPFHEEWPPASHRAIFETKSIEDANPKKVIEGFAAKAYRRPIQKNELNSIFGMMEKLKLEGFEKLEVIKAGLVAVLSSPQFLYLIENEKALKSHDLANRLAYFMWSSPADHELNVLASNGVLDQPEVIKAQVERMLKDPKAKAFNEGFSDAWVELNKFGSMAPDSETCEEYYSKDLEHAGRQETLHFFDYILKNNKPITHFLNSEYTFVNRGLAEFYGMEKPEQYSRTKFTKAFVPGPERGGLFGQMSILTATANGIDTSPIVRGIWMLHNIMGTPPSEPPEVDAIEPDTRGAVTIREQLEKHRNDANCAACHSKIDPPGFALENFDQIGRWRTTYIKKDMQGKKVNELEIDSSGVTPEGHEFKNIIDYKQNLLTKLDQFNLTLTKKLMTYGTGRTIRNFEHDELKEIAKESAEKGYGFKDLVLAVTSSEMFRVK